MPDIWWIALGSIGTFLLVIVAIIALVYTKGQLEESRQAHQGDFLLRLDAAFVQHVETHMRLRPGGAWGDGLHGPETISEWADVESYMGLFESIQILIESGILDADLIAKRYGYRVLNIANNPIIREEKLVKRAASWSLFLKLEKELASHNTG